MGAAAVNDDRTGEDGLLEPPEPSPWWMVPLLALIIVLVFGAGAWIMVAVG